MPARSRISSLASRFSMCPLRPSVMTCGCSSSSRWSGISPCLRSRHQPLLQLERLAVIDAPELAQLAITH